MLWRGQQRRRNVKWEEDIGNGDECVDWVKDIGVEESLPGT